MKKNELIEFLQRQVIFLQGKLDEALTSVDSLSLANERLVATVEKMHKQIASLEEILTGKSSEASREKAARQAVQRLQGSSSERQEKPSEVSPWSRHLPGAIPTTGPSVRRTPNAKS